jgi:hypothetical protein
VFEAALQPASFAVSQASQPPATHSFRLPLRVTHCASLAQATHWDIALQIGVALPSPQPSELAGSQGLHAPATHWLPFAFPAHSPSFAQPRQTKLPASHLGVLLLATHPELFAGSQTAHAPLAMHWPPFGLFAQSASFAHAAHEKAALHAGDVEFATQPPSSAASHARHCPATHWSRTPLRVVHWASLMHAVHWNMALQIGVPEASVHPSEFAGSQGLHAPATHWPPFTFPAHSPSFAHARQVKFIGSHRGVLPFATQPALPFGSHVSHSPETHSLRLPDRVTHSASEPHARHEKLPPQIGSGAVSRQPSDCWGSQALHAPATHCPPFGFPAHSPSFAQPRHDSVPVSQMGVAVAAPHCASFGSHVPQRPAWPPAATHWPPSPPPHSPSFAHARQAKVMFPQMGVADVGPQPELPVGSHRRQSPPTHWSSPPARATQSASAAQSTQAFAAALQIGRFSSHGASPFSSQRRHRPVASLQNVPVGLFAHSASF